MMKKMLRIYYPCQAQDRSKEVEAMAQEILCEVSNCKFWSNGNKCSAKSIYVVSQKGKRAKSSEETDCKTFVPRD